MDDLRAGITFRISIKDEKETYFISDFWYQDNLVNNQVAFESIYEPSFTLHYDNNYWYLGWNNGELKIWKKYIKNPEDCKITDNFKYLLNTDLLDLEYVNLTEEWIPCLDETNIHRQFSVSNDRFITKILDSYKICKQCFIEDFDFSEMNYKDSFDPYSTLTFSGRDLVYPEGWWFTKNCFSYDEDEFNYNYLAGKRFESASKELLIKLGLVFNYTEEIKYKILADRRKSRVKYLSMIENDLELGWTDDIVDVKNEIDEIDKQLESDKRSDEFLNTVENIIIWNFNGNQLFIIPSTSEIKSSLIYNDRGIIVGKLPEILEKKINLDTNNLDEWSTEDIYSWFKYQDINLDINKLKEMGITGSSISLITESVLKNYFNLDYNKTKKAMECLTGLLEDNNLTKTKFVDKMEDLLNNHKEIISNLESKLETTMFRNSDIDKSNELLRQSYYEEKDLRLKLELKYKKLEQVLENVEKDHNTEHEQNLGYINMLTSSIESANKFMHSKETEYKNLEYKYEQHEKIFNEKESYYISEISKKNTLILDLQSQINDLNNNNESLSKTNKNNLDYLNLVESNKNLNMLATVASVYKYDLEPKVEDTSVKITPKNQKDLIKDNTKKRRVLRNRVVYY